MSKKKIIAASIAGVLALGGAAFTVGSLIGSRVSADVDSKADMGLITELKTGKYYRLGGTQDEYIEVYSDGTIQVFNLNYLQLVTELNSNYVEGLSDEEYAEFVETEQDLVDFWNSRHYYFCSEYNKTIGIQDELPESGQLGSKSGFSLDYIDENTLVWDENHIYKYSD